MALLLPYGEAMSPFSAVANVTRNEDGVLREFRCVKRSAIGAAVVAAALAMTVAGLPQRFASTIRPNWRENTRLPRISAADLLNDGKPVCRAARRRCPS